MGELQMDYEEFKTQIMQVVNSQLDNGEYAYYETADDNVLEDCLVFQTRDCSFKLGATFSSLYQAYHSGCSLEQIAEDLVAEKEQKAIIQGIEKISMLRNYEAVKLDLYVRAVSQGKRKRMMERGIYRQFGEIVIGVYLRLSMDDQNVCTTMVDRIYLDRWGMTKEDVLKQAMHNTMQMAPPRFYRLTGMVISAAGYEWRGIPIEEYHPKISEKIRGCFFSTTEKTNGATAVFYPGIAKRICKALDTQAFYIVPTSIHEVVIHDARYVESAENLSMILKSVIEESTLKTDILSYHIFKYELKTDEITEVA